MHGGGHSKVSPFMHQATSMSSCPHLFSFRPISLHISHFPHFHLPHYHVPSPPCAHADNEMARCVHEDTCKYPRTCNKALQVCLFIFILFLCDLSPHTPPFHRIRHSQYMRVGQIMLRYRTFRMPNCFGHWRGIPSCILSPPGLPCVSYACGSCPYRAFVFFSHIVPAFGVLRGTLNIL